MTEPQQLSTLIAETREYVKMLGEIGVQSLSVRFAPVPTARLPEIPASSEPVFVTGDLEGVVGLPPTLEKVYKPKVEAPYESRLASLPSLSSRPIAIKPIKVENAYDFSSTLPEPVETVEAIRAEIGPDCTRCTLCEARTQVVHSTGNLKARLMFVGEAPGADEDAQGVPFVGRAGQLLTKIIEGIGIKREDVFIGNINRCRPPGNRPPVPLETATCRPFLLREVAVIRPKAIVVLGNTATQNLLDIKTPISKLRGNFQDYFGVKVMPTFHPAYLLRDPHKKREVWEDMKKVREYLQS